MSSTIGAPLTWLSMWVLSSSTVRTGWRSTSTMTSPARMPASPARLPAATSRTSTPSLTWRPSSLAIGGVRGCTESPSLFLPSTSTSATFAASSSSSLAIRAVSRTSLPSRTTTTGTSLPTRASATRLGRSPDFATFFPANSTMMSPGFTPALSAGEPATTDATRAPVASFRLKPLASSLVRGWTDTPSQPRSTLPCSTSCVMTDLARLEGTAKPMPTEPPRWLKMAVLIPMTSPRALMSGPPLFPGLMDASV